ncbi:MAG: V-type ATP synthase subunit A, partial [Syntrophorhabdus sp.]
DVLARDFGEYIVRGAKRPALDRSKKWDFVPEGHVGDTVKGGDILGHVQESALVSHKIMVPPGRSGTIKRIGQVAGNVDTPVAEIEGADGPFTVTMVQRWPVRDARPSKRKIAPVQTMTTGQRIIDMFFPIVKGGTACVPGPFGSGKTVVQHQLAKWADTQIVVYVGCGERGNEMTDVLMEFPHLKDPATGEPLMERTVLIANTSNMPVAAREASVFTGIAIAEYFRDMGYSVALMADSTSRWAEAMREISGRLEEMPGEEGYPAYLGSRIAGFYERAGSVICAGSTDRRGAISIIGAVSPPGGALTEPDVQTTLRVVKVYWGLDDKLAFARHFPAINWLSSYSLYQEVVDEHADKTVDKMWSVNRKRAMAILQKEAELDELVRLVGIDSLTIEDRLLMQAARMIREDFLHQNAFDDLDTYTSPQKQFMLLNLILRYYDEIRTGLADGATLDALLKLNVLEEISKAKLLPEADLREFESIENNIVNSIRALVW